MKDRMVAMAEFGRLLLTRARGKEVAKQLPSCDRLILDFEGVEVASPSFIDETIRGALRQGVAELEFANISDATRANLERIRHVHPPQTQESDSPGIELVG